MASNFTTVLVDKPEQVRTAVEDLKRYSTLSVDCEGVNLGRDGELCLLQIATGQKVYLFDIVTLKEKAFDTGLKELLENGAVTKLLYDCREDSSSLQYQYNVSVRGIEDIQILNTISAKLEDRMWQCVSGLKKCMEYHLKGCGFSPEIKERVTAAMNEDKAMWKSRPLSEDCIAYAAYDVFYLCALKEKILAKVHKSKASQAVLKELLSYSSRRYADFMLQPGYVSDSEYYRNAMLPERIIPEIKRTKGGQWKMEPFNDSTGMICSTCKWRTETRRGGQCERCYLIDNPEESKKRFEQFQARKKAEYEQRQARRQLESLQLDDL